MIVFRQRRTRVIVAVLGRDPFQLVEELVQFSSSQPPGEQVKDLLCGLVTAGIEAAQVG